MSSSYPLDNDIPKPLCIRCGMVLPRNPYCTNCGYYNRFLQTNISTQETQPSPAFNARSRDGVVQPTERPDQRNNVSSPPPQYPSAYRHNPSSATPFLGIGSDIPSPSSQYPNVYKQSSPSATPFLGISSDVPFQSSQPHVHKQYIPPVIPLPGIASEPNVSQIELRQPSGDGTSHPSSYSTQPTLIIPVELQKERKPSPENSDWKQGSQRKNSKLLLGIIISIVVLVGGGLASYLFVYPPITQKSTRVVVTPASSHSRESLKFVDEFKNNSNQWDLRSEAGKYSVAITNGNLVLEDDNNSLLPELLPGSRSFNNFKIAVDAALSRGDAKNGYGLYIRCSSDQIGTPTMYYRFELYGDGTYAIFKGILDEYGKASPSPLKLVNYTANSAIRKQGSNNHIEINAQGSTMAVRVNGQVLKTLSDPSYTKGTIALFVSNIQDTKAGAQAKFSNLTIYPS